MYKVNYKCYKDGQNKLLYLTVNDVPFNVGFSESTKLDLRDHLRDHMCEDILAEIHTYFKDEIFDWNDWVNMHNAVVCAVNELCSLQ